MNYVILLHQLSFATFQDVDINIMGYNGFSESIPVMQRSLLPNLTSLCM